MSIKIAAAQYPITPQSDFKKWQSHTRDWVLKAVDENARLLVFPEYGAMELVSLFDETIRKNLQKQVRALDEMKVSFCDFFAGLSTDNQVTIVAPSLPVLDQGDPVNRAFVFSDRGLAGYQDKLFMTRFENEEWGVKSGRKVLSLFKAPWGNFGIQTCYDIEFPTGSGLLASAGAQLILVPSCTETIRGATRVHIGARARAMENQLYTVVSQTVGNAPWSPSVDINYGFAAFYSTPDKNLPEEGIIRKGIPQEETWVFAEPDLSLLKSVRDDGQVLNFKDLQSLHLGFKTASVEVREILI